MHKQRRQYRVAITSAGRLSAAGMTVVMLMQQELFEVLAQARSLDELRMIRPMAQEVRAKYMDGLKDVDLIIDITNSVYQPNQYHFLGSEP